MDAPFKAVKWTAMIILLAILFYMVEISSNFQAIDEIDSEYTAQHQALTIKSSTILADDTRLKNCIINTLNRNQHKEKNRGLTALEQMNNIIELNCIHSNIQSIDGIEQLENLESLSLNFNNIKYLQPLRWLSKLKELNLNNNNITEITPLLHLKALEKLSLKGNKIIDYHIITELPISYIELPNLHSQPCIFIRSFINSLDIKTQPAKKHAVNNCTDN